MTELNPNLRLPSLSAPKNKPALKTVKPQTTAPASAPTLLMAGAQISWMPGYIPPLDTFSTANNFASIGFTPAITTPTLSIQNTPFQFFQDQSVRIFHSDAIPPQVGLSMIRSAYADLNRGLSALNLSETKEFGNTPTVSKASGQYKSLLRSLLKLLQLFLGVDLNEDELELVLQHGIKPISQPLQAGSQEHPENPFKSQQHQGGENPSGQGASNGNSQGQNQHSESQKRSPEGSPSEKNPFTNPNLLTLFWSKPTDEETERDQRNKQLKEEASGLPKSPLPDASEGSPQERPSQKEEGAPSSQEESILLAPEQTEAEQIDFPSQVSQTNTLVPLELSPFKKDSFSSRPTSASPPLMNDPKALLLAQTQRKILLQVRQLQSQSQALLRQGMATQSPQEQLKLLTLGIALKKQASRLQTLN
ncbi:MAG: hypothetical protein K2X66_17120 [Cyanobacteria bacterium]|nr:hypothetical protein [Cyanobacteriota bacterium]